MMDLGSVGHFELPVAIGLPAVGKRIVAGYWNLADQTDGFGTGTSCCPLWGSEISERAKS